MHNGNFYDYKELATKYGIVLETETDTEILLKLLEVVSLETAIKETMALDTPNAVIVIANGQVFAYRQHHPLFIYRNKGIYLCSRKFYKTAELMPEKEIVKLNN